MDPRCLRTFLALAAALIVGALLKSFGADDFYSLPLLPFIVWLFGAVRLMNDGGLAPRSDRTAPDATVVTPGRFVAPRSLAVVSMRVEESEPIDVVVWLPAMRNTGGVLSPEHVVGRLTKSRKEGGSLEPANFVEHEAFVQFLHQFLERELPRRPGLQAEARKKQDGWVSYVDARVLDAPQPGDGREPDTEDVVGRFHIHGGLIEPGSYQRNWAHRLLTDKGLFQLDFALRERLRQEIIARHAFRQAGDVTSDRVM